MVRFVRSQLKPMPLVLAGALLLSLGGCVAALPLGQMAYQAVTAPAKPCAPNADPASCGSSGLASMFEGLKGGVASR